MTDQRRCDRCDSTSHLVDTGDGLYCKRCADRLPSHRYRSVGKTSRNVVAGQSKRSPVPAGASMEPTLSTRGIANDVADVLSGTERRRVLTTLIAAHVDDHDRCQRQLLRDEYAKLPGAQGRLVPNTWAARNRNMRKGSSANARLGMKFSDWLSRDLQWLERRCGAIERDLLTDSIRVVDWNAFLAAMRSEAPADSAPTSLPSGG